MKISIERVSFSEKICYTNIILTIWSEIKRINVNKSYFYGEIDLRTINNYKDKRNKRR